MNTVTVDSLASRLDKLFGQTEEDKERVRQQLKTNPVKTLKKVGLKVDKEANKRFKELSDDDQNRIIGRFEKVAKYNKLSQDSQARIALLKELKPVFKTFIQWEEPLEEERASW